MPADEVGAAYVAALLVPEADTKVELSVDDCHKYVKSPVPPDAATVNVVLVPIHNVEGEVGWEDIVGSAETVTTVAALVAVHILTFVCITVYDPDVVNVAFLAVAPLLHMYDPAVFADDLKVTVPPVQKVVVLFGAVEVIEIVGVAGKA